MFTLGPRVKKTILLLLSLIIPLTAAAQQSLRIGIGTDIKTFDPHNYTSMIDLMVHDLMYDTLVAYDADMNIVPRLATSWRNVDPTTWEMVLREDVVFQDGQVFDAAVVKQNLERLAESPSAATYFGMISNIDIVDDHTLHLETLEPFGPFLTPFTIPIGAMISPAALDSGSAAAGLEVGTGPFMLKEYVPNERIVLVRNEQYWGEPPLLDEIVFYPMPDESARVLAFESGQIDVVRDVAPHKLAEYEAKPGVETLLAPSMRLVWLGFNNGDAVLSDARVRRAIASAIDVDLILEAVLEGVMRPARGPVPPETFKRTINLTHSYDPELARQLLAEAGYANGLTLDLWTPQGRYLRDREIAEIVQLQLQEVGIDAEFQVFEWAAYTDRVFNHEQQLYIIGAGFPGGDALQVLDGLFRGGVFYNHSNVNSPKLDQLLTDATSIIDDAEREDVLYQALEILMHEAMLVPLYVTNEVYALSERVEGFVALPNELIDLRTTYLND